MIKIIISGICGKMGRCIGSLAIKDRDFDIVSCVEAPSNPNIGSDIGIVLGTGKLHRTILSDLEKFSGVCDVIIEFTSPQATLEHIEIAVKKKIGIVIGTTGFQPEEVEKIKRASAFIPIVFSPNMSIGANLLFRMIEEIARSLGPGYEAEIIEAHHNQKKDAPSGTAKRLGESILKFKGRMPPIHSIRLGDIVGDHTVIFAGQGERIELTHRVHSREAFAKGALAAARFIVGKNSGLYSMLDVIEALRY